MLRTKPVRAPDLLAQKIRGEKITMLTAYDATIARLIDLAGIDVLLVGDSLGMVVLGGEDTLENAMALCPNCHRREHHGDSKFRIA